MSEQLSQQRYLQLLNFVLTQKRGLVDVGLRYDLTLAQTITLLLLSEPQPMHFVATAVSCDASNVTGIVDSLEHKGLVQRVDNPADRRIRLLQLCPKGTALRGKLLHTLDSSVDETLAELSASERTQLFQLMEKCQPTASPY